MLLQPSLLRLGNLFLNFLYHLRLTIIWRWYSLKNFIYFIFKYFHFVEFPRIHYILSVISFSMIILNLLPFFDMLLSFIKELPLIDKFPVKFDFIINWIFCFGSVSVPKLYCGRNRSWDLRVCLRIRVLYANFFVFVIFAFLIDCNFICINMLFDLITEDILVLLILFSFINVCYF